VQAHRSPTPRAQVWLDCVDGVREEGRSDVESCAAVMRPLWECMERHKDYYAPQLAVAEERSRAAAGAGEGAEEDGAAADDAARARHNAEEGSAVGEQGDAVPDVAGKATQ
jgi:hypothetical protein